MFHLLQATCAMPLLFPIFHIDGQPYLDGGCADAIPWERAFQVGCDRVVVVLTRERAYLRQTEATQHLVEIKYRDYPNFIDTMRRRVDDYNASRYRLFEAEKEGRVLVLAPESTKGFSRTERDLQKIRALWQDGYFCGRAKADEIRAFWAKERLALPQSEE